MTLTHPPVLFCPDDAIPADSRLVIHRPRRRRWWSVALGATVLVVVLGMAFQEVRSDALSIDGMPSVWRTAPGDLAAVSQTDNALGREVSVGFERSGTFVVTVALVNHGRFPVRVGSLPERGAYYYRLESVETAVDPSGSFSAFHPFTLHRGATRWLQLHLRFADCDLEHGSDGPAARSALPVDYQVFGLHRRQTVPFRQFALSVPSGRCDHPAL